MQEDLTHIRRECSLQLCNKPLHCLRCEIGLHAGEVLWCRHIIFQQPKGEDSSRPTQPWLSIIWGFSEDKISQTCTDLWSAFKTHEAIIDQHIFDNCQDCFAKHCNTRFLTNHHFHTIKRPDMISSHPGCIFLAFLQSSTLSLLEDTPGGMSDILGRHRIAHI